MWKIKLKHLFTSVLLIAFTFSSSVAQEIFKLDENNSKLVITGTSSIHDWEMVVKDFRCEASMVIKDQSVIQITDIDFSCKVADMTSNNKIMDGKAHKALGSSKHPEIKFRFEKGDMMNLLDTPSKMKGNLLLAGIQKPVEVVFSIIAENQNLLKVEGRIPLKMSDFGIEPPTAMMGTLKTGDVVQIIYELTLHKKTGNELTKR